LKKWQGAYTLTLKGNESGLVVERGLFAKWRGDLLIASLRAQTLFRARVGDGHVTYEQEVAEREARPA
jgi:glucose/arabinose dehydrogenase